MRGKSFFLCLLLAAAFLLSSCKQVIEGPADELRMFSWRCEEDNGCIVTLSFDELRGELCIDGEDHTLCISGLSIVTDDRLVICDDESGADYSFGYRLYGDRVELDRDGSVLSLKKVDIDG